MKRLFRFKYPKITILILAVIAAYYIFRNPEVSYFFSNLGELSYLGIFIAGFFFSFGFTAPLAISLFLLANPENILLAAIVGGTGALLADLSIYKIIKFSFMDEFNELENTHPIKKLNKIISNSISHKIKVYLMYFLAGIIIASPLPDEVGVTMLAGLSHIKAVTLSLISFVLNTLGILIIIFIGKSLI